MAYQDRWIAGKTTESGDRACASRYEMLRPVLESYQRQFTVWDIGANLGYFGCRISAEFGAVSIMVDKRPALVDVCLENALPTTIAMTHQLTAEDLIELAQSEHADVVLALNVLHHMPDWRKALPAVLALGENVIIETPGPGDVNSAKYAESQTLLGALLWEPDAEYLGFSESHVTSDIKRPMFLFRRRKIAVTASYAYRERVRSRGPHQVRPHTILSGSAFKEINFNGESREWHHGMNLWNWLQMGGSYPDRSRIQAAAEWAVHYNVKPHGDIKPWNMILQGQAVQVIDGGHRHNDDSEGLKQTIAMIANPELAYAR